MYTYVIDFVDIHDQKKRIAWNCSCNDPKTTLQMARGECNRLNARYGVITIRTEDGSFVSLHIFDKVFEREVKF